MIKKILLFFVVSGFVGIIFSGCDSGKVTDTNGKVKYPETRFGTARFYDEEHPKETEYRLN
jgi:uncharacterized protein YceK